MLSEHTAKNGSAPHPPARAPARVQVQAAQTVALASEGLHRSSKQPHSREWFHWHLSRGWHHLYLRQIQMCEFQTG